jgi:hypothetical protein
MSSGFRSTPCDWYWFVTVVPGARSSKEIVVFAAHAAPGLSTSASTAAQHTSASLVQR